MARNDGLEKRYSGRDWQLAAGNMQRILATIGLAAVLGLVATCAPVSTTDRAEEALAMADEAKAQANRLEERRDQLERRMRTQEMLEAVEHN